MLVKIDHLKFLDKICILHDVNLQSYPATALNERL